MADDPGAPFFNDTPKHVVSSTLTDVSSWRGSSLLGGYDPASLQRLKDSVEGGIYCYGSGTLVRAMLADGLVDELHLWVYPLALGEGPKLFPAGGPRTSLRLVASEAFDNGVVHLAYAPAAG
jgi:dihydrofolate reductase